MAKKYIHPKYKQRSPDRQWLFLLTVLSAPFLVVLGTFTFNIAAPSIQDTFHVNSAELQLMWAAYILCYAACLITSGRLGDLYGKKKIFIVGIVGFSLASSLVAIAPNAPFFISARILQGVAAALMYPQTLSLIQVNFEGKAYTFALSLFGMTLGLAAVLAQLLGGIIIQADIFHLLWRPLFLMNIPISVTACVLAMHKISESKEAQAMALDLGGAGFVALGLCLLTIPLILGRELGWPFWCWMLLPLSLLVFIGFSLYESRLEARGGSPIVNMHLLRSAPFVRGLILTVFLYAGQVSFFFLLTLYLQDGLGYSPLHAGLTVAPLAIGLLLASLATPKFFPEAKEKAMLTGLGGLVVGVVSLSTLALSTAHPTSVLLAPCLFLIGSGFGLAIPPLIGLILKRVPHTYAGSASGVLITTQQAAGSMGIALMGILFFGLLGSGDYRRAFGLTLYGNATLFLVAGWLVTQLIRSRAHRPSEQLAIDAVATPRS